MRRLKRKLKPIPRVEEAVENFRRFSVREHENKRDSGKFKEEVARQLKTLDLRGKKNV
jgi:hypothetical protein